MTIVEQFLHDGDRLFRLRSYFPLVLVPAVLAGVLVEPPVFTSRAAERAWEAGSLAVALLGLLVRAWAVGTAPAGTSERSTVSPRASELRTTGLYSAVRHPLYLANGLMAVGIALFPGIWYLPAIVLMGTILYYERIAAREEQFLASRFGQAFHDWAARVPAVVPRWSAYRPSISPLSWRKILRGEFHGLLVIAAGLFVIESAQAWVRAGTLRGDPVWTWVFGVSAVLFLVARTLKKSTRVFDTGS